MPLTTYQTLPLTPTIDYSRPEIEIANSLSNWDNQNSELVGSPDADWRTDYRLKVISLNGFRANGMDNALFTYKYSSYGTLGRENVRTFEQAGYNGPTSNPAPTVGQYIRIMLPNSLVWYGVIISENDTWSRERQSDSEAEPLEVGTTVFRAVGLEHWLGRSQVTSAMVADTSSGAATEAIRRVDRAMTFNGGVDGMGTDGTDEGRANRDPTLRAIVTNGTEKVYTFASGDPGITPALWDCEQMLEYLFAHHSPRDETEPYIELPTRYRLGTGGDLLRNFRPTIPTEGRTLFEIINQIARPSRGLCWTKTYLHTGDLLGPLFEINIHSISESDLPLPGGSTLSGNDNQFQLDVDGDRTLLQLQLGKAGEAEYDQIRFRGARQTTTFTVGPADGNLVKDWLAADETAYKAAASGAVDYPAEEANQKRRNDAMRAEPQFDRVYSAWRIPNDWDVKVGDGSGDVVANERAEVFVEVDEYGDPVEVASEVVTHQVFLPAMRFMEETRLEAAAVGSGRRLYEPPMAFLPDADGKWRMAHDMNDAAAPTGTDRLASYRVQVEKGGLAIRLLSTSGLNHTIASADFTGAAPSRRVGEVDWNDLRVTVTVESDVYCEALYKKNPGSVLERPLQELVVPMGEGYRLDYRAPHAVVGVDDGVLAIETEGGLIRDDRDSLADLAGAAMQWYKLPRKSFTASWRNIHTAILPGSIIVDVGQDGFTRQVSRVVGEIEWNFSEGTTLIKTLDGEIELEGMLA